MNNLWFRKAFRRNVIDMHVTDYNEKYLSEFDAESYVNMLVRANVQSTVLYAHSCVGKTFYPTKVGTMHNNLKGRNIVQEVVDECHKNNIAVVLYMALVFDTWAYRNHPDWQIKNPDGSGIADTSRYGLCCPNSPYRHYTKALAEEICETFEVEGMRFDMTFWPKPCYCRHCRQRFYAEFGHDLPEIINWEDELWVGFQRKREHWLTEFAASQTDAVKKLKPHFSVEHQASTFAHTSGWRMGISSSFAEHHTFLQGDFYGGTAEGSFVRKLFYNLSYEKPAGFETCISVDLQNPTVVKSEDLIRCKAFAAITDGCASIFIDTIDPAGTLNPLIYERLGKVFQDIQKYEPYLGGEMVQDCAVYLSTESKFDFADNGKHVNAPDLSSVPPHIDGLIHACKSLRDYHIPFGVITKKNIADLSNYRIVILPNLTMMDHEEVDAIRDYVRNGGKVYASKYSSLFKKTGERQNNFLLSDVFGVSYIGETHENYTYMSPELGFEKLVEPYTTMHPIGIPDSQLLIQATTGVSIARLKLPYNDPENYVMYSSIHNNPPGFSTEYPSLVINHFGQGQAIYASAELERYDPYREIFIRLVQLLSGTPFSFELSAPKTVEVTMFNQASDHRILINFLNFQDVLPNIPVKDICCRLVIENKEVKTLTLVPQQTNIPFNQEGDTLEFTLPCLETFAMVELKYS